MTIVIDTANHFGIMQQERRQTWLQEASMLGEVAYTLVPRIVSMVSEEVGMVQLKP